MINPSEVFAMTLADFGQPATLNGQYPLIVIPIPIDQVELAGGMLDRTGPSALASAAVVSSLGVVPGNDGDTLTINAIDYTILALNPDGQGGVVLTLLEDD